MINYELKLLIFILITRNTALKIMLPPHPELLGGKLIFQTFFIQPPNLMATKTNITILCCLIMPRRKIMN